MPITADTPKSVYDAIAAIIAADTGSGGLAETAGVARIPAVLRTGDPLEGDNIQWPQLRVNVIVGMNQNAFGFHNRPEVLVRMELWSKRERGFGRTNVTEANVDAILFRIRSVFNGRAFASDIQNGWDSTILHLLRGPSLLPGSTNEMRHLYEFSLIAKAA